MNSTERRIKRRNRRIEKRKIHKIKQPTFDEVYNFYNLYRSGIKCCSGVRWKTSTINYETMSILNTYNLLEKVNNNYKYDGFVFFQTVEHGKMRDIHALSIRDRIIQGCYNDNIMLNQYAPSFIKENTASLKGKGYSFAIRLITEQLRKHYNKYGTEGGIYQFDFKGYFASLSHDRIKSAIKDKIDDNKLREIGNEFVNEFQDLKDGVKDKGVGLGSPISQTIALDYANKLDHYVKEIMQSSKYGRYMDDGYVISNSLNELKEIKESIEAYAQSLGLVINPKKSVITPFKHHGFTFLKIRFRLTDSGKIVKKLNRNSIKSIRRKIHIFQNWVSEGKLSIEDACTSYQSWRGFAKQFSSYKTLCSLDRLFVNCFKSELASMPKPFKCSLKTKWDYEVGWIYYSSKKELKDVLDNLDKTRYNRYMNGFIPLCDNRDWIDSNLSKNAKSMKLFREILYDKENDEHNVHYK